MGESFDDENQDPADLSTDALRRLITKKLEQIKALEDKQDADQKARERERDDKVRELKSKIRAAKRLIKKHQSKGFTLKKAMNGLNFKITDDQFNELSQRVCATMGKSFPDHATFQKHGTTFFYAGDLK